MITNLTEQYKNNIKRNSLFINYLIEFVNYDTKIINVCKSKEEFDANISKDAKLSREIKDDIYDFLNTLQFDKSYGVDNISVYKSQSYGLSTYLTVQYLPSSKYFNWIYTKYRKKIYRKGYRISDHYVKGNKEVDTYIYTINGWNVCNSPSNKTYLDDGYAETLHKMEDILKNVMLRDYNDIKKVEMSYITESVEQTLIPIFANLISVIKNKNKSYSFTDNELEIDVYFDMVHDNNVYFRFRNDLLIYDISNFKSDSKLEQTKQNIINHIVTNF